MMRPTVSETKILQPIDPSILDDSDRWPNFILAHANVSSVDSSEPVNLLLANESCPLTITGRLERLAQHQLRFLRDRDSLPPTIQIDRVDQFSYGQYDSGDFAFWAAGRAGWFEIHPGRQYKAVYRDMVEAIGIFYFTADLFRGRRGRNKWQIPVDTILTLYSNDADHRCADIENARIAFLKHRMILLELMAQGKEGIPWKNTSIFHYLENELEDAEDSDDDARMNATRNALDSDDDDDVNPAARLAGKGKSALRPKSSKHSNKGAGRSLQDIESASSSPNTPRASSPLKRKSTRESIDPRQAKRVQLDGHHDYEDEDEDMDDVYDDEADDSTSLPQTKQEQRPLPLKDVPSASHRKPPYPRKPPSHPVKKTESSLIRIVTEPLPSFEPQGPGDTWTCQFDGCNHKVYGASTEASRELIKEHYQNHVYESQAQLDLVQREERPYLPVGNLVKKIRDMAAQRKMVKPVPESNTEPWRSGAGINQSFPQPIKQKL